MSRTIIGKTENCIVANCKEKATQYYGFLIKSRDAVDAGFCDKHFANENCPNAFGITKCYGLYNKGLGLIEYPIDLNDF